MCVPLSLSVNENQNNQASYFLNHLQCGISLPFIFLNALGASRNHHRDSCLSGLPGGAALHRQSLPSLSALEEEVTVALFHASLQR